MAETSDTEVVATLRPLARIVHDHFNMTMEDRMVAWEQVTCHPSRAVVCYQAIVNSLRPMRGEIRP